VPIIKRYRCKNCGYRFENDWYPPDERPQAQRQGIRFGKLHCPECNRTDIREGWE
jgi:transposase-like protein